MLRYTYGIELVKTLTRKLNNLKKKDNVLIYFRNQRIECIFCLQSNNKNLSQVFFILFNYPLDQFRWIIYQLYQSMRDYITIYTIEQFHGN